MIPSSAVPLGFRVACLPPHVVVGQLRAVELGPPTGGVHALSAVPRVAVATRKSKTRRREGGREGVHSLIHSGRVHAMAGPLPASGPALTPSLTHPTPGSS